MVEAMNRSDELAATISKAQQELVAIQRTCTHPSWEFARECHIESEMAHAVVRCTACRKEETRDFFHNCPVCQTALELAGWNDEHSRIHAYYQFTCPSCKFTTTQRVVDY